MASSTDNLAASITDLKTNIQLELPDIFIENATIEIAEIDPAPYAMASSKEDAIRAVNEVVDELRASDMFASYYVHMMHYGIERPIILERTSDGSLSILEGEMRCTIALARNDKIQAIMLSGHTWGAQQRPSGWPEKDA